MKNLIFFISVLLAPPAFCQIDFDYNVIKVYSDTAGSIKQKNETKKDTVSIDVLFIDGFTLLLQSRKKERTLEYKTVSLPSPTTDIGNGTFISHAVWVTTKKWVVMEERFIESVDGCYLLHPLFNDR